MGIMEDIVFPTSCVFAKRFSTVWYGCAHVGVRRATHTMHDSQESHHILCSSPIPPPDRGRATGPWGAVSTPRKAGCSTLGRRTRRHLGAEMCYQYARKPRGGASYRRAHEWARLMSLSRRAGASAPLAFAPGGAARGRACQRAHVLTHALAGITWATSPWSSGGPRAWASARPWRARRDRRAPASGPRRRSLGGPSRGRGSASSP